MHVLPTVRFPPFLYFYFPVHSASVFPPEESCSHSHTIQSRLVPMKHLLLFSSFLLYFFALVSLHYKTITRHYKSSDFRVQGLVHIQVPEYALNMVESVETA